MKKKIFKIVIIVLFSIVCVITLFIVTNAVLGFEPYVVSSSSMEPKLSIGDIIYVSAIGGDRLETGMLITFRYKSSNIIVTHEVERIDAEKQEFYAKGTMNTNGELTPIPFDCIIGEYKYKIPFIGRVILD